MGQKQVILFAIMILILPRCENQCKPEDIKQGRFNGYAFVLFYPPVSGSSYEVKFIPACKPDADIAFDAEALDYRSIGKIEGVSTVIVRGDSKFQPLFEKAIKLQLKGRDSLATQFQNVYMCRVEVDFSGVQNDTPKPNRSGSDFLEEKLTLKNGQTFSI